MTVISNSIFYECGDEAEICVERQFVLCQMSLNETKTELMLIDGLLNHTSTYS